jgi:hypothetical protein
MLLSRRLMCHQLPATLVSAREREAVLCFGQFTLVTSATQVVLASRNDTVLCRAGNAIANRELVRVGLNVTGGQVCV